MNYYSARKRSTDGKFDFTCENGTGAFPVGYCHAFWRYWEAKSYRGPKLSPEQIEAETRFMEKYHDSGHDTPEEAEACYKDYLLDHELKLNLKASDQQRKCRVCKEFTEFYAMIGTASLFFLCLEHNNREQVSLLYDRPAQIWSTD